MLTIKLLYLVPGEMQQEELFRRRDILRECVFEGTQLDAWDCPGGPPSIESLTEEYQSIPSTIERAVAAEKAGYDGILLGCYADPGIDALREMLTIPVAGPFESSVGAALTMGYRFSIVTATPEMVPMLEEMVRSKGVASHRLSSVRAIDMDILSFGQQPELLLQRVSEESKRCLTHDRADCVILGCISLAFSGADREISHQLGVPCINPITTALKMAESFVSMGLSHSKKAFPLPHKLRSQKNVE